MCTYCKKKTRGFLEKKIIYFRVYLLTCFLHTFMWKSVRKKGRGWHCLFWSWCLPCTATRWEPVASWTEPAHTCGAVPHAAPSHRWGHSTSFFKLMFSILTLFWVSGCHGLCTGVWAGNPVLQSKGFLAVPLIKHCRVSSTSVSPFPFFFVSIIWEGDMPGHVIVLPSCRKSCFPVGTKLHRSKHEHVLTGLSFLHLSYLFNLPLCVSSIVFLFLFFLFKKRENLSQSNWLCYYC